MRAYLKKMYPNALNKNIPGFTDEVPGSIYRTGKRPEVNTVSTLKPQGIEPVGLPRPKGGDLNDLRPIELRETYLEFDGSSLDIIDTYSNGTTNVRDSFSAVSGPHGNGAIPSGEWNTGNVISPTGNVGMSVDGSDFAISLDANFDLNGRSGFYIHPDGNVPGTLGCVGLNGGANRANEFLNTYTNYYNQHGSMRLIVN
jgi:hypothetical protein